MISVIVPVYNCEKYINTCADSILKQDFKDLEIIFVNDGSTDNSLEEILKIQKNDKRIKIINKKKWWFVFCKKCWLGYCERRIYFICRW